MLSQPVGFGIQDISVGSIVMPSSTEILSGWKEIGKYLHRAVRTVQRWEMTLRLPVHRPALHLHSSVMADKRELDQWLMQCPVRSEMRKQERAFPAVLKT